MRKYKILEEKRPLEDFKRWVPMVAEITNVSGEIIEDTFLYWDKIKYYPHHADYYKEKSEAEEVIDAHEMRCLEFDGKFIVGEHFYSPKTIEENK